MSASATLKHEERFDRHLVGLIGGGFLAGIVASILELIVGREVEALGALSFAAVVGLVINQLDPREDTALVRLILALIGGVTMAGVAQIGVWGAPWLAAAAGGVFLGAALSFDRAQTRRRKLWTWGLFGATLPAGVFTAETLFHTGFLQALDVAIVREALVGTSWGVFLAVAAGMSDLRWERDSVVGRLEEAISRNGEPVCDYLESARELYKQVARECERAEQDDTRRRALEIAGDTVDSLLRFAARFEELRESLGRSGAKRLERRLERMNRRLQAASSPSVASEVKEARAQVLEQLQMRERLELGCARLESSLQRGVTTLEKLHLTLVQHATSTSNDAGLTESLSRLEQLADEVELKSLSVDELCQVKSGESGEEVCGTVDQAVEPHARQGWDGELDASQTGVDVDATVSVDETPLTDRNETSNERVVCEHNSSC